MAFFAIKEQKITLYFHHFLPMTTAEILKRVRRIEIKTKGLSNHIFAGEYHSAFKGRGMSFSEVREYQVGDDVKSIDWNVTARFRTPFVKVFEEERELTVMLLVDISRSQLVGSSKRLKRELVTELCAVLAFAAATNNDKVGVIFFGEDVEQYIPPKKGRSHILRIIRELIAREPAASVAFSTKKLNGEVSGEKEKLNLEKDNKKVHETATNLARALEFFNNAIKRKTIAFVLSDFLSDGYERPLMLAARRHDLVGIRVYDELDKTLPNVGLMHLADAETGKTRWLDTGSKSVRMAYEKEFDRHSSYAQKAFHKSNSGWMSVRTDEDYVKNLQGFFKNR